MFKIGKKQYTDVIPLLKGTEHTAPTNAWGIVEGYIEGEVFSNKTVQPDAVLIGTKDGVYFVCGEPDKAFLEAFEKYYLEKENERFTLFSPNKIWDNMIESMQTENTKKMKRKAFRLNEEKFQQRARLLRHSDVFEIKPVSSESIMNSRKFDKDYYQLYWGSIERFLKYGAGYYAVNKDREILSECTAIFRSKERMNIDIYTLEKARGSGLAYGVSKAFIAKCLQNSIAPVWDCDCENIPSAHLAGRLGFDQFEEYHLYYKQ
ncbi:GNAT family N-acetyltransferase [Oceanobacillus sp. CFH 90083]|uniref:GNAT family N-acetyltransferase n=1 Tax=Oceanobacillus sp. CFH 90083 TaxID=2592336 RepID=UPI00128D814D|nr:GNAT family N-acetyltransferase [Oceanobacillus sp. CFH 90083]